MANEADSPSEEILWSGSTSHWYHFGRWFFGLLFVAAITAAVYHYRVDLDQWMPWPWVAPGVLLLLLIIVLGWQRSSLKYRVTGSRVIVERGRFVVNSNEIRLQDIRSINVTKGGISGLMGIGNVEFSSAATDDAEITFARISDADGVRDLVRKLQT